jgi:hypothetical protein
MVSLSDLGRAVREVANCKIFALPFGDLHVLK